MRAADRSRRRLGQAEVPDLALLDQVPDRARDVFDRHVRVHAVLIEQVDRIDAQPFQRALRDLLDVLRPAVHAVQFAFARLGSSSNPNFVAITTCSRNGASASPTSSLVHERAVGLRGVEERDAELDRRAAGARPSSRRSGPGRTRVVPSPDAPIAETPGPAGSESSPCIAPVSPDAHGATLAGITRGARLRVRRTAGTGSLHTRWAGLRGGRIGRHADPSPASPGTRRSPRPSCTGSFRTGSRSVGGVAYLLFRRRYDDGAGDPGGLRVCDGRLPRFARVLDRQAVDRIREPRGSASTGRAAARSASPRAGPIATPATRIT